MILTIIQANTVIGAGVWAAIDEDDKRFFKWFQKAPCVVVQIMILNFWFVALAYRAIDRGREV
jgi:hypothetical protein